MTAAEFLDPLKRAGQKVQVQAALYFYKKYADRDRASVAEVREALTRARVPGAKRMNITRALADSVPLVHQPSERGVWEITGKGEEAIQARLGLPEGFSEPEADVATLRGLAEGVADEATRDYIEEAVKCLGTGARRAAVVFLWTGAVSAIRDEVWKHGAVAIEAALKSHNPKSKFVKKGDFATVKDSDLIQVAQDLSVYDKSEKKRLGEALDLRNDCGHPVKYKPGEKRVSSFVEDLTGIVFT